MKVTIMELTRISAIAAVIILVRFGLLYMFLLCSYAALERSFICIHP